MVKLKEIMCFIVVLKLACGDNAGMKTRITQKAIDFFTDPNQILPMLPEIPDLDDSTEIAVLGKVDYRVYDITVLRLSHSPKSFISVLPGVGLSWQGGELRIVAHAKWTYDTHSIIPVSDKGSVKVKVTIKSTPFALKLGKDESGRLTIAMKHTSCHFDVREIDIELSGGKEWLYNLFEDNVEDMLKKAANEQICSVISDAIRYSLADTLSTMEVFVPVISDVISIDLSLLADPTLTSSVDLLHSGRVFDVAVDSKDSLDYPPLAPVSNSSHMFYIWLTDHMLNTAGEALYSSGYLAYTLTQEEIPKNSTFQMNTASYELSLLIPQINKLHPNKEVRVSIYPSSPPSFELTDDAVEASVAITIELLVVDDDDDDATSTSHVVSVKTMLELTGNLGIEDSKLTWSINSFSCQPELLKSDVQDLDFDILDSALRFACHAFIKQYIKDAGSEGIPIGDLGNGWKIVNPSLQQGQGVLGIGMDLKMDVNWS